MALLCPPFNYISIYEDYLKLNTTQKTKTIKKKMTRKIKKPSKMKTTSKIKTTSQLKMTSKMKGLAFEPRQKKNSNIVKLQLKS